MPTETDEVGSTWRRRGLKLPGGAEEGVEVGAARAEILCGCYGYVDFEASGQ